MADYKIGYGKPPKGRPFQPGQSGNPKGRPRRAGNELGEVVRSILDAEVDYRENGRTKTVTRRELRLRLLVQKAVQGDVAAALLLLKKRCHALRQGEGVQQQLIVHNWLPELDPAAAQDRPAGLGDPGAAASAGGPGEASQDSPNDSQSGFGQTGQGPQP